MAEKTTGKSRTPLILLGLLVIVMLLGALAAVKLRSGIEIQRISLASFQAEGIFLQVENGIIITVDRLDFPQKLAALSIPGPDILIDRFNKWAYLFREVRINSIHRRGHVYTLLFRDNRFTLSDGDFHLAGVFSSGEGLVRLAISNLEIQPYSAILTGEAVYSSNNRNFTFNGRFNALGIDGKLSLSQQQDMIDADIQTDSFSDIGPLLDHLPGDQDAVTWVSANITARNYRINTLHMGFTLRDGALHFHPLSLSGIGIATDAAISFHPSLPPVRCSRVNVSLADNRLSFDLDSPIYKNKNLAGSSVGIAPLLGDNTRLSISLQTESRLDSEIHALLNTYGIQLPLTQQKGTTRGELHLVLDLPDFTLHTQGAFTTEEGNWTYNEIAFSSNAASVRLEDNLVIIDNAELSREDAMQAHLTGTIDTSAHTAAFSADIRRFDFYDAERELVRVRNLTTPIKMNFNNKNVNITLPELQAEIALNPSQKLLSLNEVKRIQSYLPPIRNFPLQEGKVTIDFTNRENLTFDGFINTEALPLSSDDRPVNHYAFQGRRTREKLSISINQGKISLTAADRLDIALHDYLVTVDTDRIGTEAGPSSPLPVFISGPRSLIRLGNVSIPTTAFQAELKGQELSFTAGLEQGKILFEKTGTVMTLAASDIDAMIAQDFFRFADLEGGRFDLSLEGRNKQNYEGFVEFSNVLIKDALLLNNILSFINAIPALATLSEPGFNSDGYNVRQGVAHFARSSNLLTIQRLRTDGTTINAEAEGWVDIENDILKIDLELISLKDYSKIISKIPWAGYAILGEDGSFSTSLLLSGNRHDPDITTNLPSEIVMMPINIVKRAIQWPFSLFDRIKDSAGETSEADE